MPQRVYLEACGSTLTASEDRARLFVTGRRVVRTISSSLRSSWWSCERVKNVKTSKPGWVSRTMLLERRLRRRLSRIIARLVSSNMPACRLDGVVHLILYLFAAKVASTLDLLDLTVCDLCYGCSGVWKLLIWSVLLGITVSEFFDTQFANVADGLFQLAFGSSCTE